MASASFHVYCSEARTRSWDKPRKGTGPQSNLVLFQVGLDLGLAASAVRGLVHGQQDHLVVVGQHAAVQAAVHGADILGGELGKLVKALRKFMPLITVCSAKKAHNARWDIPSCS
jgi:hypothetical protein